MNPLILWSTPKPSFHSVIMSFISIYLSEFIDFFNNGISLKKLVYRGYQNAFTVLKGKDIKRLIQTVCFIVTLLFPFSYNNVCQRNDSYLQTFIPIFFNIILIDGTLKFHFFPFFFSKLYSFSISVFNLLMFVLHI